MPLRDEAAAIDRHFASPRRLSHRQVTPFGRACHRSAGGPASLPVERPVTWPAPRVVDVEGSFSPSPRRAAEQLFRKCRAWASRRARNDLAVVMARPTWGSALAGRIRRRDHGTGGGRNRLVTADEHPASVSRFSSAVVPSCGARIVLTTSCPLTFVSVYPVAALKPHFVSVVCRSNRAARLPSRPFRRPLIVLLLPFSRAVSISRGRACVHVDCTRVYLPRSTAPVSRCSRRAISRLRVPLTGLDMRKAV